MQTRMSRGDGVDLGICRGAIYLIEENNIPEKHYYVVLNNHPKTSARIIMVHATTHYDLELNRIEKAGFSHETLVRIKKNQSRRIPRESAFNCNNITATTMDKLKANVQHFKSVTYHGQLETSIVNALQEATLKSTRLSPKQRRCITE